MQTLIRLIFSCAFILTVFISQAQQKFYIDSFFNRTLSPRERDSINQLVAKYSEEISKDSANQQAYFKRAEALVGLGMQHKAVKDYNVLIGLDSLNPVYLYNRAICKSKYGYSLDACRDFYKAGKLGLDQAHSVYLGKCGLYFKDIEKQ